VAELAVEGGELRLVLSRAEKLEGLHGDLTAPLSAVRSVEVLDDAHRAAMALGFKVGTRIPGVVEVAQVLGAQRRLFVAVHRATPRGLRIGFGGGEFDEWVVGCEEPETVARGISAATGVEPA
jgi:hypothetical protein